MLTTVNATEIQRKKPRDSSREDIRKKSNIYSFFINGKRKIICKTMYLNTISEQFVKTAQLKGGRAGLVFDDQRGKHIPSNKCDLSTITNIKNHIDKYPVYSSHYSREKVSRFSSTLKNVMQKVKHSVKNDSLGRCSIRYSIYPSNSLKWIHVIPETRLKGNYKLCP